MQPDQRRLVLELLGVLPQRLEQPQPQVAGRRDRPGPARSGRSGSRSRGSPGTGAAAAPGCRLLGLGIGVLVELLQSGLDLRPDGLAAAAGHLDQQVERLGVLDLLRGGGLDLVRQGVEGADLAGGLDQGRCGAEQSPRVPSAPVAAVVFKKTAAGASSEPTAERMRTTAASASASSTP